MSTGNKNWMICLVLYCIVCVFGSVSTYNEECLYGFYCDGMYDPLLKASCVRNLCKCSGNFVQTNCLPHVSQCVIQHGLTAQAHPAHVCTEISSTIICSQDFETYHCNSDTNQNFEVHVLASHQAISCCSDFPESSKIEVFNEGQRGRKIVLVLASTRPVNWFLDMEYGTEIDTVVLVHKSTSLATVAWSKGNVKEIVKVSNVSEKQSCLYGKGRDTIDLLRYVDMKYGPITSFTGRFQVQQWRLSIGVPFKSDISLAGTPSRHAVRETATRRPISTIGSSKHNQPTSTPPLYPNTPRYTTEYLPNTSRYPTEYQSNNPKYTTEYSSNTPKYTTESSSRLLNLQSRDLSKFSSSSFWAESSASHQTPTSSSVSTYREASSVNTEAPQVLPSSLVFFHAFGTLEFNHISGLNYYANGTLKIRAPVTTQLINSTSEVKHPIITTSSLNKEIISTISPSSTTIQSVSEKSSSTLVVDKETTILKTSNIHTTSSLAPTTTMSSIPNMVTSSTIITTRTTHTSSSLVATEVTSSIPNTVSSSTIMTTTPPQLSCAIKPCHDYATCIDTINGVSCTCNKGYVGDGFTCVDTNECESDPCPTNSNCENTPGSYNCSCREPGNCRETRIIGEGAHTGRVEVLHNGQWGTICTVGWDTTDAQVACRDAGYPYLAGLTYSFGFGKIWLSNIECDGSETKLSDCPHPGWGNVNRLCTHQYDIGVECVPSSIRLAGSNRPDEGRIEIYFDGQWGTICDNGWDIDDANIACTEMGFAGAERVLTGNEVEDGKGRIWLDNMECTGVLERNLKQCFHSGWGNVNCGHERDAGVKCRPKVSCDFEINTCSWRNEKQDDDFDWQRHRASTPTLLTGPSFDNTKGTIYGVYVYIETTGRKPGDKAWLVSPTLQPKSDECLRFHYFMKGADIGQLNVNLRRNGTNNITRLWNLAGATKNKWIEASVPLKFDKPSEIIFEATSGDDQQGDIAIDDIILVQEPCSVYPSAAAPDTDECLIKPCDVNAECTNTIGSYECKCKKGYTGNGTHCTDLNECMTNPCHVNATCTNTIGGFSCQCNPNTEGICDDAYRPCGLREIFTQLDSRIIGGHASDKGSWPWMASIFYSKKKERIWCGGALFNNQWILTAAHCFDQSQDVDQYTVILGDHDILTEETEEQRFKVDKISVHYSYSPHSKNYDIALVRLHTPANYTANILPICLQKTELPAGTNCVIAGWGTRTTNADDYPQFLQEAVVPIVAQPTCQALYGSLITISYDMVCAGYTTGTVDACKGDSGGPLMCQQGNKWYLAGLTSFGFDCAAKGYPGVYANVANLYNWIEYVLIFD